VRTPRMRSVRFGLLLVVASIVAIGAGGAVAAPAKSHAQVTVSFLGTTTNKPQWDVMIANFERVYPDINVEPTYVPSNQYGALLLTQLQSGGGPDLMQVLAGATSNWGAFPLGFQGKLLDLTGSPWVKRMYPGFAKWVSVKRRIYGAPTGYGTSGLMYNKDLFKQLGLTVPKTFPQLLSTCQKIKDAGKIPIVLGLADAVPNTLLSLVMTTFVYGQDPNWTLERIQKKTTFASSKEWQRALQAVVQLKDSCIQPNAAAMVRSQAYATFARGDAVMYPAFASEHGVVKLINPNLQLGDFPLPADAAKDSVASYTTAQNILVANKATKSPKEAKLFIDFTMRPKQNALFAKVGSVFSGDDLKKGNLPAEFADQVPLLKAGKALHQAAAGWPRPDKAMFTPVMTTEVIGLFTGQRTVAQILQNMDTLWDKP
jgi:raffinose/stachyose/melibiose transport system substrate-binding protein